MSTKKASGPNAAIMPSEKSQLAKHAEGICLVKGCNNKANVGPLCASCAGKRAMMKRRGEPMDPVMDFAALEKAQKAKEREKAKKEKAAAAEAPTKRTRKPKAKAEKAPESTPAPAGQDIL